MTSQTQTVTITLEVSEQTLERLKGSLEFDHESIEQHAAELLTTAARCCYDQR